MHHRYETNSNSSSISSSSHGVFLGTAREKRDRLLRKAYFNQQRNGVVGGWQPHTPSSPLTTNETFSPAFRYYRHHPNPRTHSVDSISSSTTATTTATIPIPEQSMPRTSSQTSLNIHRASPCPSDISFSYSNPKYFVRTAVLRPASALKNKAPLHYENVLVSDFNTPRFELDFFFFHFFQKQSSFFEDKQRRGANHDESTFRSPTPGPDFSTIHRDSITLEELIDRLTPTPFSTPEVSSVFFLIKNN